MSFPIKETEEKIKTLLKDVKEKEEVVKTLEGVKKWELIITINHIWARIGTHRMALESWKHFKNSLT